MKFNSPKKQIIFSSFRLFISIALLLVTFSVYAQLPSNVKNVKVDELSDDQIRQYISESSKSGITQAEQDKLALQNGMPPAELEKLKARVAGLSGQSTPTSIESIAPAQINNKQIESKAIQQTPVTSAVPLDANEIYGHHLFKNNNLQFFEKATDVRASDNYILGVNDELAVSVFGYSYYNEVLKIDQRGNINPSGQVVSGPIYLKGLTYKQAIALLKAKFGQFFDLTNNQITINLAYSRVISVNFVGEVSKPGTYKISALNPIFNALVAVGGPNPIGSVRNIQVKRGGKVVKKLDVYEYLNSPSAQLDFFLEDNDYVFISPSKKLVRISGEVRKPMKFELTDKENLNELLEYAGGLTPLSYTKLIRVSRVSEDGTQQQLLNISLDSLKKNKTNFILKDGDEIDIAPKSTELIKFVEIQGSVNLPGKFELKDGDRVSDLIKNANGVRFETLQEKAYLIRLKDDLTREFISINIKSILDKPKTNEDLVLQKGDVIRIASNKDFSDELTIAAIGAFRKPTSSIIYSEGMTVGDLLFMAGGLKMEADELNIEISRISFFSEEYKPGESSRFIIKIIKVGRDVKIADDQMSFKLRPFDQVFARTIPDFQYQQNFTLNGEVKYPGLYSLEYKDEKLSSVIKRAGGLNRYAFPEAATLYRPELPGGYIVMNLKDALKNESSKYNYIVKAGDVINIPTAIDFIAIRGNVEYLTLINQEQVNAPFIRGRRANYYVKEFANGFTKTSFRRKVYTVDNSSKVNRTKNFVLFKIYPKVKKGATVYVVTKPETKKENKKESPPIDWNKRIEGFTIKLTGIVTLMILIQALRP